MPGDPPGAASPGLGPEHAAPADVRLPVLDRRRAGVLLHLAALGPGALGEPGHAFVDWLAGAGFTVWQILPVGPTGTDGSPYWLGSDHAGNPSFIDEAARPRAAGHEFDDFQRDNAGWLPDYALFTALRAVLAGAAWIDWPAPLRERDPRALEAARLQHRERIAEIVATQFAFHVQWRELRRHAASRGVRLFGDLPIYVAQDSVETWAHREQFLLDAAGRPSFVAGVPPDYFSAEGQRWGNPLYDWARMRTDGFAYWRERVRAQLARFDLLRIDHFRGLAAHWAVPAAAPTARDGSWVPTPGAELFGALARDFAGLPFVAEDLGVITPDVTALRREFGLPGMKVLQFGFDGAGDNPHLPHMHAADEVVYAGTHDNDTVRGWLSALDGETLRRVCFYLRAPPADVPEAMLRAVLGSVGRLAVVQMQDLLELGSEARYNTPGTVTGNWAWRLPASPPGDDLARRCALLNRAYGRT
jgi:4-alpha-glucanotransferase